MADALVLPAATQLLLASNLYCIQKHSVCQLLNTLNLNELHLVDDLLIELRKINEKIG